MQLNNHTFMITGGASGLGAAAATMLVEAGAGVALVDLNGDALQQRVAELGEHARAYVADIADEQQAAEAVAAARRDFGQLHGLINCAGIAPGEKILGRNGPHCLPSFERTLRVNLLGSFNMLRLVTEVMAEGEANGQGERGVIINTASVAAYDGQIGQVAYAASKGGGGQHDPAGGAGAGAPRPSGDDHRAWHLRHADEGRHDPGGARFPGSGCAFPATSGTAAGVRGAGAPYHREPHAEWRSDPSRR